MLVTYSDSYSADFGSSNWMALCEYDGQLVPILTPCSAASLRLKNIRLPKTQGIVGLPDVWSNATTKELLNRSDNRFAMKQNREL